MSFFSNLFSQGPKVDLQELLNNGAVLIDVRTKGEYAGGHANNSKNIPLDELPNSLKKLDKGKVYIVVCASGARSGSALNMMKRSGFTECYNGGSWYNFK